MTYQMQLKSTVVEKLQEEMSIQHIIPMFLEITLYTTLTTLFVVVTEMMMKEEFDS